MTILLDHTIVPAREKWESARFFAAMFGAPILGEAGPFVQVRVNDSLTLDFETKPAHEAHHYAFRVDTRTFDAIVGRIKAAGVPHGSGPEAGWDGQVYTAGDDRGLYFNDPSGHSYEIITTLG
jgi:catechol 2,3-dioxygenase-like lactoylglutathione lyase family enzyme